MATQTKSLTLTTTVSETISETFVSTTLVVEPTAAPYIPREVWICEGVDCKIFGADHDHDDGMSGGEVGLLVVLIIIAIIFIVLLVLVVKVHLSMKDYSNLKQEISKVGDTRQDIKKDVTQAGESLKAHDQILNSNARELEHINGPAQPEGKSHHPAANQPMVPLRTTVHDFQRRLQDLETELENQRISTRDSML